MRLDDTGFLRGNLRERIAQKLRMIEADIRDNRQPRRDDIRRIQAASEPYFYHRDIHFCRFEKRKRHAHCRFKKRGFERIEISAVVVYILHHRLLRYHLSIDADTFTKIHQMRTGIEAHAQPRFLQGRSDEMRCAALAVGAGNMDGGIRRLRIAQMVHQRNGIVQTGLIRRCSYLMKSRLRGVEISKCFFV